ncbi:MAG: 1-acyl-sn-glycerol-3-phosphate acyltransferase [Saprospiraceae bacterium]|nr:1-acyl-sn-glycerol-3-phosphate acyltransferase [Saprospiraceae bacterium]
MHPILRLIYLLLRLIVWISVRVFYRRRLVLGRQHLRFDGPAIVIANHPSTLMDVLNPAVEIRQEMFFLANYGMFKHPVANWLLRRLYCIPVKRREDVAEGENRNNYEAFEQSFQHLEKNGVLFIAPEGTSWMNRFVRSLKSGTARIAFGAESRNHWQLDVKIIPVGLSYTAPHLFRSDVVVHFGAPVYPRDWAEAWTQNRAQAVDDLTTHLENQLKALSIHTRDEAGEQLLTRLEEMLQNEQPLPQNAAFERSQQLLTAGALDNTELSTRTQAYFKALEQHQVSDAGLVEALCPSARRRQAADAALLLLGLPVVTLPALWWFLPCYLPWWINKKLGLYIGYSSTIKIMTSLFLFPLALWGGYRLAAAFVPYPGLVLAAALVLGLVAERYLDVFHRFRARQQALRKGPALHTLAALRQAVLDALRQAVPAGVA